MSEQNEFKGFSKQACICDPIVIQGQRNDNRGLNHGTARSRHGKVREKKGTTDNSGEDTEMVMMFAGQKLPSDAEIIEMKRISAIEGKWYNRLRRWFKNLFGLGE